MTKKNFIADYYNEKKTLKAAFAEALESPEAQKQAILNRSDICSLYVSNGDFTSDTSSISKKLQEQLQMAKEDISDCQQGYYYHLLKALEKNYTALEQHGYNTSAGLLKSFEIFKISLCGCFSPRKWENYTAALHSFNHTKNAPYD
jgi:hypothetical protein